MNITVIKIEGNWTVYGTEYNKKYSYDKLSFGFMRINVLRDSVTVLCTKTLAKRKISPVIFVHVSLTWFSDSLLRIISDIKQD